jgi:hypothetical protein
MTAQKIHAEFMGSESVATPLLGKGGTNSRTDLCSLPAGSPGWVTPELIADTIRVWQPYYRAPLTSEDALGMIMNVGQLFDVLFEGRKS